MLGQVMPRALRLLQFPTGGLSCYLDNSKDQVVFLVKTRPGQMQRHIMMSFTLFNNCSI